MIDLTEDVSVSAHGSRSIHDLGCESPISIRALESTRVYILGCESTRCAMSICFI